MRQIITVRIVLPPDTPTAFMRPLADDVTTQVRDIMAGALAAGRCCEVTADTSIEPEPPTRHRHNGVVIEGDARQTACRFCGSDIEGIAPYRRGQWRDRGGDTKCPGDVLGWEPNGCTIRGPQSRQHAPVSD